MTGAAATRMGGRPGRGRSSRPARPSSKEHLRRLVTICMGSMNTSARSLFCMPAAAMRMIRARTTSIHGADWGAARRRSLAPSPPGRAKADERNDG